MQRQRLDERLHSLREEVRTMSQDKQRGERVWRDRLQRAQLQLRAKEEEAARQSQYFERFKAQLQHKLSQARDREQALQSRAHLLERRLLELTVSAATACAARVTGARGRAEPERPTHPRGEGEGEEEAEEEEERKRERGARPLGVGGRAEEEGGGMKGERGAGEEEGGRAEKEEEEGGGGGEARLRGFILSLQEDLRVLLEREEQGVAERRALAEQLQEAQENGHFLSGKVEEMRAAVHALKLAESSLTEEVEELQEEILRLRGRAPGQRPAPADAEPGPAPGPAAPQDTPPAPGLTDRGPRDGSDQAHPSLDQQKSLLLNAPPSPCHQVAADSSQPDKAEDDQSSETKHDKSTLPLPKPDLLNLSGHRSPSPSSSPSPGRSLFSLVTEEVGDFSLSLGDWSLEEGGCSEETEALSDAYRSLGGGLDTLRGHRDQLETALLRTQEELQRLSLENARLKLRLRQQASDEDQGSSKGGVSGNKQTNCVLGQHITSPEDSIDTDPPGSSPTPQEDPFLVLDQDDLAQALNQENRALAERIQELLAHLELQEGEAERELAQLRLRVSGLEGDRARLGRENQEQAHLVAELTRKTEDDLNAIMELQQKLADAPGPRGDDDRALESGCGQTGPQGDRTAEGLARGLAQGDHEIESADRRPPSDDAVESESARPQVDRAAISVYIQQWEHMGGFVKTGRNSESAGGQPGEQCGRGPDDRQPGEQRSRGPDDRTVGAADDDDAASRDARAEREELRRSLCVLREERRELGLSVHGQTEEKHQLTLSLWTLKEERDQVSLSLQALKEERDALTRSLCGAREERRKLTQSTGGLEAERDQLSRSVRSLQEERDRLMSGQTERERMKQSLHGLQQEIDQAERSLCGLREERERLGQSLRSLTEERDAVAQCLRRLEEERDRLAASLVRHEREKRDQLTDSLCGPRGERDEPSLAPWPEADEGESGGREGEGEGQDELMREIEAMGVDLRVSQEELEKSQSEAQRWHRELGVSEDKRSEVERRAAQATEEVNRMREGAKEEEEERRKENDLLRKEVGEVKSRLVRLEREKSEALSLKTQTEEQLNVLQAQLKAKTVALEELNSEYTALRSEQRSREEDRDTFTSLRTRYDDIRAKYDALLRKRSQTDLDMAPLKAKLSCLVAKCQRRNGVLAQMMRVMRGGSGRLDLSLSREAEDLLNDSALQEYAVAFSAGHDSARWDAATPYASVPPRVPWPAETPDAPPVFSVIQGLSTAVSQSSSGEDSRPGSTSTDRCPTPDTPLTPTLGSVQVPAAPDWLGMYQAEVKGEAGPVPVTLWQEKGKPRPSSGGWEGPSRGLSCPEKIVNLQQQLQKTLSHSYQAPERRVEAGEAEIQAGVRGREQQPTKGLFEPASGGTTLPPQTVSPSFAVNVPNRSPSPRRPIHTSMTPTTAPSGPIHTPGAKAPSPTTPSRTATNTPSLTTTLAAPSGVKPSPRRNTPTAGSSAPTGVSVALTGPAAASSSTAPGGSAAPLTRMAQVVSARASAVSFKAAPGTGKPPRGAMPKAAVPVSSASATPAPSQSAPACDALKTDPPPAGPGYPEREGGVGQHTAACPPRKARANSAKQEAPAEVGSVDVIRVVGQSSLMIGWERPPLDELGCSNGTFVYGYRVYVDGEFHKSVMSSACTKCILENLDLGGPVNMAVQTLGSHGLYAAKVSAVFRGGHAPLKADPAPVWRGPNPPRTDHARSGVDSAQLRSDSASPGHSRAPPTHKGSGSSQSFVAIYSYSPLRDSPNLHPSRELALREGDAVTLLGGPRHDGFCEATVNGRRGLAPIAFLEEVPLPDRGSPGPPPSPPERGPADWLT